MNDNNTMNEEHPVGSAPVLQHLDTRQEEKMEWEGPVNPPQSVDNTPAPWLKTEEVDELQSRWNSIQVEFVDDPRTSVEQARTLTNKALELIEREFSTQRAAIDAQWVNHVDASTEDLRIALQRYRSFLNRLLE